jgi:hypothetical protein
MVQRCAGLVLLTASPCSARPALPAETMPAEQKRLAVVCEEQLRGFIADMAPRRGSGPEQAWAFRAGIAERQRTLERGTK